MKSCASFLRLPILSLELLAFCGISARASNLDEWHLIEAIMPRHYVCQRALGHLTVDGKIDEAAWEKAPWTEDFADIEGMTKPKPRFRTRAKMLWDDNYLYIAAELEEPHVWATLKEHDSVIFMDPDFEVFIDPNGDSHNYYEFEMNALNTSWDLLLKKPYLNGGPALNSWDIPGLKTGVSVHGTLNDPSDKDEGWTLEIAFPWKVLEEYAGTPSPPNEGDQWRMGFSRVEWDVRVENGKYVKLPGKKEDNWVWSPQGVVDMHRPEQWGFVQFTTNTAGPVAFRPDPAFPFKRALQAVYYAQRDFNAATGRWARDLDELSGKTRFKAGAIKVELKAGPGGYTASTTAPGLDGKERTWHIREDALVWGD